MSPQTSGANAPSPRQQAAHQEPLPIRIWIFGIPSFYRPTNPRMCECVGPTRDHPDKLAHRLERLLKLPNLTYRFLYFTFFCMDIPITSTELVRHLGDVLAKVKHAGQSFLLTKSARPLARIVPVSPSGGGAGRDINEALAKLPCDPSFAEDLERVNRMDSIPSNPWA